jgi:predicted amidohydrolase YtcJ
MMKKILATLLLAVLSASPVTLAVSETKADAVIINADIRTMNPGQPRAEALAINGNRISAVGTNSEIQSMIGTKTNVIDAKGRLVVPGFNDSHVHFLDGGMGLSSVDLRDAQSPEEFVRRIGEFAKTLPKGRWILNGNWDHENWKPAILPTRQMIDSVTPDNPVFINRLDGHMALANSLALKLAGVDRETKDVEFGEIVKDSKGDPTGVLKDAAMGYVNRVIPELSFEQKMEYIERASEYAASLGVTSVHDMSAGTDVGVYQELIRQGRLKTRIYAVSPLGGWKRWENTGVRRGLGNEMLRVGGLKGFADGSLGSTTALFFEPYLDSPNTSGLASDEIPFMYERVAGADRAGLQMMIHAIGDRGNDIVLGVYEKVIQEHGAADRRFRIEHAQHLNQEIIGRFARAGVVASMQPFHAIDDGRWAWKRLDSKRLEGTYAFRALLDSGVNVAFGTDWFVAPLNPMWSIFGAVTRRTLDGLNPGGWIPAQKITVEETVRAYTVGSAYAEFQEDVKGQLKPGMLADIVILSDNIFTIPAEKIWDVTVIRTIVDGKTVFEGKN